ncbi:MAG: hypothetical protein AAF889_04580 [Cyanobacteria bacterium P01_D01_bin.73]
MNNRRLLALCVGGGNWGINELDWDGSHWFVVPFLHNDGCGNYWIGGGL